MKALITGASSGLGWDMAHILSDMGYDIIAVARRRNRLEELKKELKTNVEIVTADISDDAQCMALSKYAPQTDILINNAGFGVFGQLTETSLDDELKMIDTNVRALHILTKLFATEFQKRNFGHIMNVSSLASFFPGPLFGAYYASKSYVLRLSQALAEELRRNKSAVKISVLCPGPVNTEFSYVAKVNFGTGTEKVGKKVILTSRDVAEYAIRKMFSGKEIIVPGAFMKISAFMRYIVPDKLMSKIVYTIQSKKCVIK